MLERPAALTRARPAASADGGRSLLRWAHAARTPAGRVRRAIGWGDQRLLLALRTSGHSPALERTARALGAFGELGAGWTAIALTGSATRPAERNRWLTAATVAPAAILANYAVKILVGRERPLVEEHPPLARAPSKLSFPSAHSTSAVAAAIAIGRVAPGTRAPLYGLAAAICLGRPYLGMHYPTDVLAGVALGALIGRAYPLPAAATEAAPDRVPTEDLDAVPATPVAVPA